MASSPASWSGRWPTRVASRARASVASISVPPSPWWSCRARCRPASWPRWPALVSPAVPWRSVRTAVPPSVRPVVVATTATRRFAAPPAPEAPAAARRAAPTPTDRSELCSGLLSLGPLKRAPEVLSARRKCDVDAAAVSPARLPDHRDRGAAALTGCAAGQGHHGGRGHLHVLAWPAAGSGAAADRRAALP